MLRGLAAQGFRGLGALEFMLSALSLRLLQGRWIPDLGLRAQSAS